VDQLAYERPSRSITALRVRGRNQSQRLEATKKSPTATDGHPRLKEKVCGVSVVDADGHLESQRGLGEGEDSSTYARENAESSGSLKATKGAARSQARIPWGDHAGQSNSRP